MKKLIFIIISAALLMLIPMKVAADIIFEPEDKFYHDYRDKIRRPGGNEGRYFIVSEDTDVYDDPNGNVIGNLSAGRSPSIPMFYTDDNGAEWGGFYYKTSDSNLCWIKLEGAELIYDNIEFMKDHKSEFRDAKPSLFLNLNGSLYLWDYPGSSGYRTLDSYPDDVSNYISYIYTDADDRDWGYISYIWGAHGWVFIDAPSSDDPENAEKLPNPFETTALDTDETENNEDTEDTEADDITETLQTAPPEPSFYDEIDSILAEFDDDPDAEFPENTEAVSEETKQTTNVLNDHDFFNIEVTTEKAPAPEDIPQGELVIEERTSYFFPVLLAVAAAAVSVLMIKTFGKKK